MKTDTMKPTDEPVTAAGVVSTALLGSVEPSLDGERWLLRIALSIGRSEIYRGPLTGDTECSIEAGNHDSA